MFLLETRGFQIESLDRGRLVSAWRGVLGLVPGQPKLETGRDCLWICFSLMSGCVEFLGLGSEVCLLASPFPEKETMKLPAGIKECHADLGSFPMEDAGEL